MLIRALSFRNYNAKVYDMLFNRHLLTRAHMGKKTIIPRVWVEV